MSGLEGVEAQEGFAWQVAAVRRHLSDLAAEAPEAAHLRGIAEAVPGDPLPTPALRLCLTAYAYFLEHEARLDEALDVLGLASRAHGASVPAAEFAAIALFAGRLNRLLARWAAANTCYERAENSAQSAGDMVTMLRSRLGRSSVLRGQGNLPLSLEMAVGGREAGPRGAASRRRGDGVVGPGRCSGAAGARVDDAVQAMYQRVPPHRGQRSAACGCLEISATV